MNSGFKIVLLSTALFFLFNQLNKAQEHWESIVIDNNVWRYLPATSEPEPNWMQSSFNDSTWETGKGGFGFGDNDDSTVVDEVNSIYLRKTINISDTSYIKKLLLDVDYDDAFVCYINGEEVARSNNIFSATPAYNEFIFQSHEAQLYQQNLPERYFLNKDLLLSGNNLLAVQIINSRRGNDMSGRVFLHAAINSNDTLYQTVPVWFTEPLDYSKSNLPLILIDTDGRFITDEPKIDANMKVINTDTINSIFDTIYEYNGKIGIEVRGNTSQMFDKKSYLLETRTSADSNLNVRLLGMPEENDWILYGPFSDKSLIRNSLAYHLGNQFGNWSPRTRFCELFINNEYVGVYVFMEKIKISNERIDIAKLKPEDNEGDQLTGGYVLRVDRNNPGSWVSPFYGRTGTSKEPISYYDPKYDELTVAQKEYIKKYVTDFEYALASEHFANPEFGYRRYIDVSSFIDLFIITELSRDLDGYRCSVYFHKDKDSKGGKLNMSPLWDFNLCFGNGNFFEADNPEGWVGEGIGSGDGYEPVFWWNRLLQDPYFVEKLNGRWDELRKHVLSVENINYFIDSCALYLNGASERNFQKFNILNRYVWPNAYIGGNYENEISYLKNWISDRISWMDANLPVIEAEAYEIKLVNPPEEVGIANVGAYGSLKVFPVPFNNQVNFRFNISGNTQLELKLFDVLGKVVYSKSVYLTDGIHQISVAGPDIGSSDNLFIYKVYFNDREVISGKVTRQ